MLANINISLAMPINLVYLDKNGVKQTVPITQETILPAGTYHIKAKIRPKLIKQQEILHVAPLVWSSFNPLRFTAANKTQAINLQDFDELWFDYTGSPTCAITSVFKGANWQEISRPLANFTKQQVVAVATAQWLGRNAKYLIKRELGLAFDENWYYFANHEDTVLVRRWHQNLQNIPAIDLIFAPNTKVNGGHIRLSLGDHLKTNAVINFDSIPQQIRKTSQNLRLRLYIHDIDFVGQHLQAGSQVFLAELGAYVAGPTSKIAASRNLNSVIFQENDAFTPPLPVNKLLQEKQILPQGKTRLHVDLRPLADKSGDLIFMQGQLSYAASCAIKPEDIRLVTLGYTKKPMMPLGDGAVNWLDLGKKQLPEGKFTGNWPIKRYFKIEKFKIIAEKTPTEAQVQRLRETHVTSIARDNYWFSIVPLFMALVCYYFLLAIRGYIKTNWPIFLRIYHTKGTVLFAGAMLNILIVIFCALIDLEVIAEQAAIVAFYLLITGALLELYALKS